MSYDKFLASNSSDNLLFSHQTRASTYLDFIQKRSGKKHQPPREKDLFPSHDEKMLRIQDIIWQIATTEVPVLITGEPGVGKKIIAQAIHQTKLEKEGCQDKSRPFLVVDCITLSPAQVDKELFPGGEPASTPFGQEGTIVIHEIANLDCTAQTKLLRMLQEKEAEQKAQQKSGGGPARIIATTSCDILGLVSQGKFRQDLYYRLYVLHIDVPPLRQRPKDIVLLASNFLAQFKKTSNRPNLVFAEEALAKLVDYQWPGNIRELEKVVQKAFLLTIDDVIKAGHINMEGTSHATSLNWVESLPIGQCLRLIETQFILETLKYHKGNRTHAAKSLGISLRTLRNKINEFTAEGLEVVAPVSGRAPR